MKVLHVLYSGLGGHGNVFFSLAEADKKNEFEFSAIFNGIEEVRAEYHDKCRLYNIPWNFVSKQRGFDFKYYKQLVQYISKSEASVVFLHSSSYVLPAIIANLISPHKKKIIVRETQANHLKSKMEWIWLSVALVCVNKMVFLSEDYNNEIRKRLRLFYNRKKVQVIPNGINLAVYAPIQKPPSDTIYLGMQSRLVAIKDHSTLLKAFAMVLESMKGSSKKLVLKIAGDGETMLPLVKERSELGLDEQVEFAGMLSEQELLRFLQSLDIYIHASFGETMSTAIMQAMAQGLPIIASDVNGINNMIKDHVTGLLVPVQDKQAMANAMKELQNNFILQQGLGKSALAYAEENFSNEIMFEKYSRLFKGAHS